MKVFADINFYVNFVRRKTRIIEFVLTTEECTGGSNDNEGLSRMVN